MSGNKEVVSNCVKPMGMEKAQERQLVKVKLWQ
jgi:hypothetical protein